MLSHTAKIITKKTTNKLLRKKKGGMFPNIPSLKNLIWNFILRSLLEHKLHQNVDYATKVQTKTDKSKKQRENVTTQSRAPEGFPPHPPSLNLFILFSYTYALFFFPSFNRSILSLLSFLTFLNRSIPTKKEIWEVNRKNPKEWGNTPIPEFSIFPSIIDILYVYCNDMYIR